MPGLAGRRTLRLGTLVPLPGPFLGNAESPADAQEDLAQRDIAEIAVETLGPETRIQVEDQILGVPGRGLGPDHPVEFLADLRFPPLDIGLALGRPALRRLGPARRRCGGLAIDPVQVVTLDLFLQRQRLAHGLGGAGEIELKTLGDLIAGTGRIGGHAPFPLGLLDDPLFCHLRGCHAEFGQFLQHRQALPDLSFECAVRAGFRLIRGGIVRSRVGKGGGGMRVHIGRYENI